MEHTTDSCATLNCCTTTHSQRHKHPEAQLAPLPRNFPHSPSPTNTKSKPQPQAWPPQTTDPTATQACFHHHPSSPIRVILYLFFLLQLFITIDHAKHVVGHFTVALLGRFRQGSAYLLRVAVVGLVLDAYTSALGAYSAPEPLVVFAGGVFGEERVGLWGGVGGCCEGW